MIAARRPGSCVMAQLCLLPGGMEDAGRRQRAGTPDMPVRRGQHHDLRTRACSAFILRITLLWRRSLSYMFPDHDGQPVSAGSVASVECRKSGQGIQEKNSSFHA